MKEKPFAESLLPIIRIQRLIPVLIVIAAWMPLAGPSRGNELLKSRNGHIAATADLNEPRVFFSTTAAPNKILIFTKTTRFYHESIPAGAAMIQALGRQNNFAVDATDDAAYFTDADLAQYKAVVFLSTTGDVLNSDRATFSKIRRQKQSDCRCKFFEI